MKKHRPAKGIASLVALVLVTLVSAAQFGQAQDGTRSNTEPEITVSQLKGTWTAGCAADRCRPPVRK
jgi:hypothetical protein